MKKLLFASLLLFSGLPGIALAESKPDQIPESARVVLENAETIEIFSLDPQDLGEKVKEGFHGWKVLGQTKLSAPETQKLKSTFQQGVAENKGALSLCFNPRHGIRAIHGAKTADFVVCFECMNGRTYLDQKRLQDFLTINSSEKVFDELLTAAKVPLAAKSQIAK